MHNYGLILKQLRQLNSDSLKTAAQKIGKSVGWLSEVENGRGLSRLKQSEFERIVKVFGGDWRRRLRTRPLSSFKRRQAYHQRRFRCGQTLMKTKAPLGL